VCSSAVEVRTSVFGTGSGACMQNVDNDPIRATQRCSKRLFVRERQVTHHVVVSLMVDHALPFVLSLALDRRQVYETTGLV
jgi:hypothetical protein